MFNTYLPVLCLLFDTKRFLLFLVIQLRLYNGSYLDCESCISLALNVEYYTSDFSALLLTPHSLAILTDKSCCQNLNLGEFDNIVKITLY